MAKTLQTVEHHLRLDPDAYIMYYFVCNVCWFRHHPSELPDLDSPDCLQPDCSGTLYTSKTLNNGRVKRTPLKILPTAPLIPMIQRYLLRPGKYEEFQHWRGEGDEPGPVPPVPAPQRGLDAFSDRHKRMTDIYDGWGWRAIEAGLQRRRGGEWGVEDVDVKELNQRFVSLPCGLVFMLNIDWFCPMKRNRKYSTGAVYLSICNNPRTKCFLPTETVLACVIPGPTEPSLEHLNYVIEPLVRDIQKMYNGLLLRVHSKPDPEPIHGTLYINASDLPASRKAGGLRGHTSKKFMCSLCYQTLGSLTCPDCYNPDKFRMRDDRRFLKYAYRARNANPDDRDVITEKCGVRWSILDVLPGWMPARDSPIDFMHAIFLIEVKHLLLDVIIKAGLLLSRSRDDKPQERFDARQFS